MTAGILLSVREKATRLPGKVLKPLGDGNVTQFLIRRLRQSKRASRVVLATSIDPRDAALATLAEQEGIAATRGSKDDKLLRYRDACRAFSLEFAVIVDGDDPFVSVEHIDRLVDAYRDNPADYMICEGLPLGATGFGIAAAALERVCDGRPEQDTEVWARLFLDDRRFLCRSLPESNPAYARPDIRMTLDYEEDYRFFVTVVEGLRAQGAGAQPTFAEIMAYLAAHPEAVAINQGAQEKYEQHLSRSLTLPVGGSPQ